MNKQEYIEKYGAARYKRLQEMNRARKNGTLEEWKKENGFLPRGWNAHSDERKAEIIEKMKESHRANEKYKQCEGKHQCEDHEQWKRYMREYRRQYYLEHKEEIAENNRKYIEKKKANGGKLNVRRGRRTNAERRTTQAA